MTTTTGGRCACGAPVSAAKSHIGRRPIYCENCRRFLSKINTLRGNWRRNREIRANRKPPMTRAEITQRYRAKRYIEIGEMPRVPCACGCGTLIAPISKLLKSATFTHGHNRIGSTHPGLSGADNPRWKGGRSQDPDGGYIRIRSGQGHRGLEHRLVMERALGRSLLPGEKVHHRNGIKHDNRPENLELWTRDHPSGVRVSDLIEYIVNTYPEAVRDALGRDKL